MNENPKKTTYTSSERKRRDEAIERYKAIYRSDKFSNATHKEQLEMINKFRAGG